MNMDPSICWIGSGWVWLGY